LRRDKLPIVEGQPGRKLRIVFDARHVRDYGIGTHIRNLIGSIKEIDHQNQYTLLARSGDQDAFDPLPPNFRTVVWDRTSGDLADDIRLPLYLRSLRADVHHIPLNAVPLFMPKPYVVTIHDMGSLIFPQHEDFRRSLQAYRFRHGLIRADQVIAVSGATSRDLQNVLNIPGHRIRVVYNAPDPVFMQSSVSEDQHQRRQLEDRYQVNYPYLLYAGTIRTQKNVPRLVEAFAVLRDDLANHPVYRNLRLVIIGDELSRYPQVRRAVIQSKMESLVRFLGFVPIETLRAFYTSAAAFVFPSLYEGFGLPPLEAMACGTPVVTSNSSSLPEVVGDAAIIVNPENVFDIARGIREVLLDEVLRRRCVRLGLEQLKRFSWKQTAEQVVETYAQVAARGR
jgi:glycosyltransferase involved in cell wall biosynthesis